MFDNPALMNQKSEIFLVMFVFSLAAAFLLRNTSQFLPRPVLGHRVLVVVAATVAIINLDRLTEFIYFNF